MAPVHAGATVELFVILTPFREVLPELAVLLRPLRALEDRLVGLEGYASSRVDAALVNLRLPRAAVDRIGLGRLADAIVATGLEVVVPETLVASDRDAFYLEHLASYDTYVQLYGGGVGRVVELVAALAAHLAAAHRRPTTRGDQLDPRMRLVKAARARRAPRAESCF